MRKNKKSGGTAGEIRRLYEEYGTLAYSAAIAVLENPADAEDAVQFTFESLMKNFQRYKDLSRDKMAGLIVIISRNAAINIYNRYKKYIPYDDGSECAAPDTLDIVISRETYDEAVDAIKKLPEAYRDAFFLRHVYGFDNDEIAEMFGITEENVRQRLSRARKMIVKTLRGGEDDAKE